MSHLAPFGRPALALAALLATAAPALAWEIVPHRAVYRLELGASSSGSSVTSVAGQMLWEWSDACDGWVVDQRYRMVLSYAQGNDVDIASSFSTWESKDGDAFSFTVRNETNGEVDKELLGEANATSGGRGSVLYRMPEGHEQALPRTALFPTEHTLELLDRAEAGDFLFGAILFDGTELDRLSEVSAAIGRETPQQPDGGGLLSPLLQARSWPVRLAFYPTDDPSPLPEYEFEMRLHDNGVIDQLVIDYGDFLVRGSLTMIEPITESRC